VGGRTTHGLYVQFLNRSAHRRSSLAVPEIEPKIPVSVSVHHECTYRRNRIVYQEENENLEILFLFIESQAFPRNSYFHYNISMFNGLVLTPLSVSAREEAPCCGFKGTR
jgi:hypothetical protein